MKKMMFSLFFLLFAVLIMLLSIAGPEFLARYWDKATLGQIYTRAVESDGEGYRYTLSSDEKLCILFRSLGRQVSPEGEQYALIRDNGCGDLDGIYAFVLNHKGPSGKEITDHQIYETCNQGLTVLKELGILPNTMGNMGSGTYGAALYPAIDMLEPENNVTVWKLELASTQKNTDRENRLMEVYIDADSEEIYGFYARTPLTRENMDPGRTAEGWAEYMGLETPMLYETDNPLIGATPYFSKYVYSGMGDQKTIATIGFYEGINKLFSKISR